MVQNKRIWDVPKVDDVENDQLHVLKIVIAIEWMNTLRMTLCTRLIDLTANERSVVHHVVDDFIDNKVEQLSHPSRISEDE